MGKSSTRVVFDQDIDSKLVPRRVSAERSEESAFSVLHRSKADSPVSGVRWTPPESRNRTSSVAKHLPRMTGFAGSTLFHAERSEASAVLVENKQKQIPRYARHDIIGPFSPAC
jgi:hypothetical protein